MKTASGIPLVDVSPNTMYGDTPLEKELNAYLTKAFIGSKELPADECLHEAKFILSFQEWTSKKLTAYLEHQFGPGLPAWTESNVNDILKLLGPAS